MTTGLLEDLFTNTMVLIDRCFLRVRLLVRSFLDAGTLYSPFSFSVVINLSFRLLVTFSRITSIPWLLPSALNPKNILRKLFLAYQRVKRVPQKLVVPDQLGTVASVSLPVCMLIYLK